MVVQSNDNRATIMDRNMTHIQEQALKSCITTASNIRGYSIFSYATKWGVNQKSDNHTFMGHTPYRNWGKMWLYVPWLTPHED